MTIGVAVLLLSAAWLLVMPAAYVRMNPDRTRVDLTMATIGLVAAAACVTAVLVVGITPEQGEARPATWVEPSPYGPPPAGWGLPR